MAISTFVLVCLSEVKAQKSNYPHQITVQKKGDIDKKRFVDIKAEEWKCEPTTVLPVAYNSFVELKWSLEYEIINKINRQELRGFGSLDLEYLIDEQGKISSLDFLFNRASVPGGVTNPEELKKQLALDDWRKRFIALKSPFAPAKFDNRPTRYKGYLRMIFYRK